MLSINEADLVVKRVGLVIQGNNEGGYNKSQIPEEDHVYHNLITICYNHQDT